MVEKLGVEWARCTRLMTPNSRGGAIVISGDVRRDHDGRDRDRGLAGGRCREWVVVFGQA